MVTLEVFDGTQTFTYSSEIQADALEREERATSDAVEPGGRTVSLIADTFMGLDEKDEIPDSTFRARLLRDGIVLTDGVIRRPGIVRKPDTNEWTLSLEADAKELFLDYLKASPISTAGTPLAMDVTMIDSAGLPNVISFDWWELEALWTRTMDELDVQIVYQDMPGRHWFVLDVDYLDVTTQTITRKLPVYITTPDTASNRPEWSAHQLFEHLQQCLAWRIKVSYLPFPSTAYRVTILTDRWSDPPAAPVDITSYLLDRERTHECEDAEMRDFALQYANQVQGEDIWEAGSTRPAEVEIYAANNRQLDVEGESDNSDAIQLDVRVPDSRDSVLVSVVGYQPDATNHPGYLEDLILTQPVINYRGAVYQCGIHNNAGTDYMVLSRAPQAPAAGQAALVTEHYAITLAQHYEMRRSSMLVTNVKIDIDEITALPSIADPLDGVTYEGDAYMVRGMVVNDETGVAELELARIAETPILTVDLPDVCPPSLVSATCVDPPPDLKVLVNFQPPEPGCGSTEPVSFDLYYYKPGLTLGWEFLANLPAGTHYYEHIRSGATAGEYIYRVESINSLSIRSNPAYTTVVC